MPQSPPLSRRRLLGSAATLMAAATASRLRAAAQSAADRPNILWLVSEDNNPLIGAYGDKLAHTPNIDALAGRSILYRNAFSNAPVCAPTRFTILTGVHSHSCAPANQMRAVARAAGILTPYPEVLRQAGYYCTNNAKTDYNCDIDPKKIWDDQGKTSHWKNRPDGMPFMAVFNFETTHESRIFRPTNGVVKPDQVRVPPYLPDTPGIRQDYASYYNLMTRMDAQIGEKIAELETAGLADDTIIFYYSDNGGVLPRSKRYCTQEGLHCALIIHVPPKWAHLSPHAPGTSVTSPVSFVDLAPTVVTLAGGRVPATMQGKPLLGAGAVPQTYAFAMRNRMDERYDFVRSVTDGRYRYTRNYMPHLPLVQNQAFSWLARGYQDWDALHRSGKLNDVQSAPFKPRVYEEFYDLDSDPDGVENRIDHPAHRQKISAMRRALDTEMLRIFDNGFIPEGSPQEGYVASRDPAAYPLKRIMALGQAAARRDPRKAGLFERALGDGNAVVRYWAAMGLFLLGQQAGPAGAALRSALIREPSKQTRVVMAEALVGLEEGNAPIELLGDLTSSGEILPVRIQALNALTRIGPPARIVLPAIEAASLSQEIYVKSLGTYLLQTLNGSFDPYKPIFDIEALMRSIKASGAVG